MTTQKNILAFCMDSLRYDMFMKSNAPNLHRFTEYEKVYSRAGCTPPSLFSIFMNECWYESRGFKKLVQWHKSWCWLPSDLRELGFYTAFLSDNWMIKLYHPTFKVGFDEFNIYRYGTGIGKITKRIIELYDTIKKPKFIFVLTMETHQPYKIKRKKPKKKRTVTNQIRGVEYIDTYFKQIVKKLQGTNTEITVFSDHGDLDPELEGSFGHGPRKFHPKLFEIPLGRKTI